MRGELTIVVPMAPPPELLPNSSRRLHWSVRSDHTSALRIAACGATMNEMALQRVEPFTEPVVVSYAVTWPHSRYKNKLPIPDHDAIPTACKGMLDGIVDAGLIGGDSEEWVAEVRARGRRGAVGEDGCTVVTLVAAGERAEAA